jgi:hypothetical protein
MATSGASIRLEKIVSPVLDSTVTLKLREALVMTS